MTNIVACNNWWLDREVKNVYLKPYKRSLFYEIIKYINDRQILILLGLRRVGKTTLMYQIIQELLNRGENPKNIFYFSFDDYVEDIETVLTTYSQEIVAIPLEDVKAYVFLDEIQKQKGWQEKLKLLYDRYPLLKFIVSGSSSISVQKSSRESLSGRCYQFHMDILSFEEFLEIKHNLVLPNNHQELLLWKDRLHSYVFDYIKKPFPEITNEEDDEKVIRYIKDSVIEKIIFKDLPLELGLKDIELLNMLISLIIENPGFIVNIDELSNNLKRNARTISNYLYYLESAQIIRCIKNFRKSKLSSSRKMKKAYPIHPALVFAFSNRFYDLIPKVVENLVSSTIKTKYYWRENKDEVDFLVETKGKIVGIEVKYREHITKQDLKSVMKFISDFNSKVVIVTKDSTTPLKDDSKMIEFVPLSLFILNHRDFLKI